MTLIMLMKLPTLLLFLIASAEITDTTSKDSSLEVVLEKDDRLIIFSTIDGSLTAVEQQTGLIKWKIKEKPIVQVPLDISSAIVPIYLPDPRDGSLYLIGNVQEPLKKLPFTIPQLVSTSPCRSSDGILYTGKKKDTWFKLDPSTGKKQQILGWDDYSPTCPVDTELFVYIGRSQYNLRMVDEKQAENKWNITFYDYAARPMTKKELNVYDFVHFTSTSTGQVVTLNRRRGNLVWEKDMGSPVIGVYLLDSDGLLSLPFTSLANNTIAQLTNELVSNDGLLHKTNHMKLYPTLYIGEHLHGLFALPSLVDQSVVTISGTVNGPLLLGGPHASESYRIPEVYPVPGHNYHLPADNQNKHLFQSLPTFGNHIIIYTGHYNLPKFSNQKLLGLNRDVTPFNEDQTSQDHYSKEFDKSQVISTIENHFHGIDHDNLTKNNTVVDSMKIHYDHLKSWINRQENKGLKISLIIMTGSVIGMFWYLQIQVREVQKASRSSQQDSQGHSNFVSAVSEELPNGLVKIGKILFHPDHLLGKGCEGTFVYRGEFDNRRVAVKRLLPECFTLADREVALLRESDAHPHVIRYYCTEQDRMFRYIALELCQATLTDYIEGKCDISPISPLEVLRQATSGLCHLHSLDIVIRNYCTEQDKMFRYIALELCQSMLTDYIIESKCDISPISPLEVLRQATSGLCHLHSLDIVHRDIKPHNVLISVPDNKGQVRAMISDFGLCKKLQVGRVSFSRRSGITGTDGWIAPEMLNSNERTTYAVDMFSLGCLYYYVLSKGSHPFGDSLRRQANILTGKYDLNDLKGPAWLTVLYKTVVTALISSDASARPSCRAVLDHPMFWSYDNILSFFQEVSDRVEKADIADAVLLELESDAQQVVRTDWRMHIHDEVASDLKKYRSYNGSSVRDLLRALRNKKHHFRELSAEAQYILGKDSETFTLYWLDRFPLLFSHTWTVMQCVAHEDNFKKFYNSHHRYSSESFEDVKRSVCESASILSENRPRPEFESHKLLYKQIRRVRQSYTVDGELVKSGGLYRNHGSPEKSERFLTKKKRTKKSDEPLVWVLDQ